MRNKGAPGVTTVESVEYGMPSIAALSRQLHSPSLSGPSLSRLTSLLKPGPPPKEHPLPRNGLPPRPLCSTGISATFHPRPCPRLLLSYYPPPPFDTNIHTRGPYCLWGHTPIKSGKKEQWRQEQKHRPEVKEAGTPECELTHDPWWRFNLRQ